MARRRECPPASKKSELGDSWDSTPLSRTRAHAFPTALCHKAQGRARQRSGIRAACMIYRRCVRLVGVRVA